MPARSHRHNFLVKQTLGLRFGSFLVRRSRESVLVNAADAVPLRHVLGRQAHVHDTLARVLGRTVLQLLPQLRRNRPRPIILRHALHPASNPNINLPDRNAVRDPRDSRQARTASAVDRLERGRLWDPGVQGCHAAGFAAA
jgi:hypothetical protein